MDKLTVFALLVLLTISAVCDARPALFKKLPKLKQPSVIRKAALYANPFDWIGTPTWPHRTVKKKTNKSSEKRQRYRWFVEVDGKSIILHFLFRVSNVPHY